MEFTLDPKPIGLTLPGRQYSNDHSSNPHSSELHSPDPELNRRRLLKLAVFSIVGAELPGGLLHAQSAPQSCSPPIPQNHAPSNGGPCPYPIPWLDKNGNHNQSPMPSVELSNIYHFKWKLARCNGFHGMGTDNKGNRLAWGTPTTDFSYMAGEYWAARQPHQAIFAHTWLTLFKGPAVPQNQIHDFHPPISPKGLYWITTVPSSGLTFSSDETMATLRMSNIPIIDQPSLASDGCWNNSSIYEFQTGL